MRHSILLSIGSLIVLLSGCVAQPPNGSLRSSTRPLEQQLHAQDKHIEQLAAAVQQLSTAVDTNQTEIAALRNEIKAQRKNTNKHQSLTTLNKNPVQPSAKTLSTSQQETPAQPKATELYLDGFSAYTNGDYVSASESFTTFINDYPRNPYVANAYYWLGKSYLAQGHLELAAQSFTTLVNDYPDANKAADGMLRLAQVYAQSNQRDRAQSVLLQLQQHYPDSTASKKIPADLLESLSR